MAEKVDNFMVFRSLMETIDEMDAQETETYIKAVLHYGFDGTVPEFSDKGMQWAFKSMRHTIDNSRANVLNGQKGGRPKKGGEGNNPPNNPPLNPPLNPDGGENGEGVKTPLETPLKTPLKTEEEEEVEVEGEEREPLIGSLPPLEKDPDADGITDETANLSPIDCPECLGHETHRTDGIWECGKCGWRWRR